MDGSHSLVFVRRGGRAFIRSQKQSLVPLSWDALKLCLSPERVKGGLASLLSPCAQSLGCHLPSIMGYHPATPNADAHKITLIISPHFCFVQSLEGSFVDDPVIHSGRISAFKPCTFYFYCTESVSIACCKDSVYPSFS